MASKGMTDLLIEDVTNKMPDAATAPTAATGALGSEAGPSSSSKPLHIRLATPVYGGWLTAQYATCVLNLQREAAVQGVHLTWDLCANESLIQRGRNMILARFLQQSDADKLFFVDSDISFDPANFLKLAKSEKDATSAGYFKKHVDWNKVRAGVLSGSSELVQSMGCDFNCNLLGQSVKAENGTIPVLDAATGFMCLSRGLLERMCKHYEPMTCTNDIAHTGAGQPIKSYVPLFDCISRDPKDGRYLSEDYSFCRRMQQMGETMYMDMTIPLGHLGNAEYPGDAKQAFTLLQARKASS